MSQRNIVKVESANINEYTHKLGQKPPMITQKKKVDIPHCDVDRVFEFWEGMERTEEREKLEGKEVEYDKDILSWIYRQNGAIVLDDGW